VYVAIVLWRPLLAPLASRRLSLPSSSLRGFSQKSIELLWRGACTCRNQGKRPHTYHGKSVSAVMLPRLLPGSHRLSSRRPLTKPVSDSLLSVCPISPYICPAWCYWQHTVSRSKQDYATDQAQKCRLARSRATTLFPTAHPWHSSLPVRSVLGASNASPSTYSPSLDNKSAGAGTMNYESRVWT